VLDSRGHLKSGDATPWTIAGPLCFAGDIVARDTLLPAIEVGDFIAVRDVGAYTLSMWSRHCSRGMPLVLGFSGSSQVRVLRRSETPADIARFWSLNEECRASGPAASTSKSVTQ
jgi:diaminopimelate decarboxylase